MLTMSSVKKSLIVEQFQGNYLKNNGLSKSNAVLLLDLAAKMNRKIIIIITLFKCRMCLALLC